MCTQIDKWFVWGKKVFKLPLIPVIFCLLCFADVKQELPQALIVNGKTKAS